MFCPECDEATDTEDICRNCGACEVCCDCDQGAFDADELGENPNE